MSNTTSSEYYISLIMKCLKDNYKLLDDKTNLISEEIELDILSDKIFEQLYKNFRFFYVKNETGKKNEEEKYIFSELVKILYIIYESNSNCFYKDDFLKSILIYLIYSFKKPMNINLELALKIFFEFGNHMKGISTEKIDQHLSTFEDDIIGTTKALIDKFIQDYQINLAAFLKKNKFNEIMKYISKCEELPLYLQGFDNYYQEDSKKRKFLISILFKYIEKINPFKNNFMLFNLYQGYALYELFSYQNTLSIDFKEFNDIKINRIKNENAKNILILSIKLLNSRSYSEFIKAIFNEDYKYIRESPKISDSFDDTNTYYEDLNNQLKHYLTIYEENNITCKIINEDISRILWLNFVKILLVNLNEGEIRKNEIKIIFYLIVNLFNPDINYDSLEFRDDTVMILFFQCEISNEILDNQEIYRIIDNDFSQYYPPFIKINTFNQAYINFKNNALLAGVNLDDNFRKMESEKLLKCNKNLPFLLFKDYLKNLNYKPKVKYSFFPEIINNLYKNCFCDVNNCFYETFFANYDKAKVPNNEKIADFRKIFDDNTVINLINDIMKSDVMKDAYNRLYIWYSTDGEFDINKEYLEENDFPKENGQEQNLINGKTIKEYYDEFFNSIINLNYFNRFIIMALPEKIKGFTISFLKICINSEGINIKYKDIKHKLILLKAYLIFVIIQELNQFIKIYFNSQNQKSLCNIPIIKISNIGGEEGKQLIKLLFDDELINKCLNVEKAEYILDINNWTKKSVIEFRNNFPLIKIDNKKDEEIVYLSTEKESMCDHSKLFA